MSETAKLWYAQVPSKTLEIGETLHWTARVRNDGSRERDAQVRISAFDKAYNSVSIIPEESHTLKPGEDRTMNFSYTFDGSGPGVGSYDLSTAELYMDGRYATEAVRASGGVTVMDEISAPASKLEIASCSRKEGDAELGGSAKFEAKINNNSIESAAMTVEWGVVGKKPTANADIPAGGSDTVELAVDTETVGDGGTITPTLTIYNHDGKKADTTTCGSVGVIDPTPEAKVTNLEIVEVDNTTVDVNYEVENQSNVDRDVSTDVKIEVDIGVDGNTDKRVSETHTLTDKKSGTRRMIMDVDGKRDVDFCVTTDNVSFA